MDNSRTLKNSEADLLKAREDLKEVTRAKDSTEASLAGAQKQAEDQTRRLLEVEEQLHIAKEQIVDLKKKLAEVEGAKNVAIWAKDEAVRAKEEAEFARTEAEEEAYDAGVAETEAALKAQVPGVCKLYCSQVWNEALKRASVDASSDLWKAECVFYPPAIREDATRSSEVRDAPEGIKVASPSATPEIIFPQVPAEGSGPSRMAGADESQDPDAPKETAGSVSGDPVPLAEGSKDPEISPAQPSLEGIEDKSLA